MNNQLPILHYNLTWTKNLMDPKHQDTKVTKREVTTENQTYTIIRYDKKVLGVDLVDTYGLLRSVIFDKNGKLVSFAPPKSVAAELFLQHYSDSLSLSYSTIVAEEFVEGTMIQVFWDATIGVSGAWEIATRNSVGANISFYQEYDKKTGLPKSKTFRQMFLEAMEHCKLSFDHLLKDYCYSFVLQHPENRIVIPFKKPALYLIAVYQIIQGNFETSNKEEQIIVYPMNVSYFRDHSWLKNTFVKYPKKYQENTYTDLIQKYASMNTPYNIMGVVIRHLMTGERCKIRNPVYERIRELKGNQAKLQYQYLVLRQAGKIAEYLQYYPEHRKEFSSFRDAIHLFTKTLYENYISCFIQKKNTDIYSYPKEYQGHMQQLHHQYLNNLREQKQAITYPYVIEYINNLPSAKLMYSMNTPLRERNIEMVKVSAITSDSNVL